jgi:hypothetical protein
MNEVAANKQCIPYRTGATNRNANSIGSVIPVKKDVSAAEKRIPPAIFSFQV